MGLCMAPSENLQLRKGPTRAPLGMNTETMDRRARVEHLRQMVANGTYRVSPQRLALKILVKALRQH